VECASSSHGDLEEEDQHVVLCVVLVMRWGSYDGAPWSESTVDLRQSSKKVGGRPLPFYQAHRRCSAVGD
jgi:hypothetical protein